MFDFLLPTYVVAKWSDWNQDYTFLCTFNSHCIPLANADKFYFRFMAERALKNHTRKNGHSLCDLSGYEVVDYRELGYSSEDARSTARYTFG
jgi:hypothetical protein